MRTPPEVGVYLITCEAPDGDVRYYVGQSNDFRTRMSGHKSCLRRGKHGNSRMQHTWDKYGESAFTFELFIRCPVSELDHQEQLMLDVMATSHDCMNIAICATSGMRGLRHSDETKAKMREVMLAGSAPWKGKTLSATHRANLSASHKGQSPTAEQRARISAKLSGERHPNYGTKRSPETIAKIKLAKRTRKVVGTNLVTGEQVVLPCQECAAEYGFNKWHVSNCAKGKEVSHKGYRWEYVC